MTPIFKISKIECCKLEVLGLEYLNNLYSENFSYDDAATLDILIKVDSKENETVVDAAFCEHTFEGEEPNDDYVQLQFPSDGLYKVVHIILPTLEYIQNHSDIINNYTTIYCYYNGKVYKVNNAGIAEELETIEELIEINYTEEILAFYEDVYTFNLCNLKKCFYNIVSKILNNLCSDKCAKQDILSRDLVWMALNAIQYCLDVGNFFEAQRVLEKVTSCNGVCPPESDIKNNKLNNCGCNG